MTDFLVIGQGLAGSFVTDGLLKRGCSVHCADPLVASASTVAVGLLNPVVGKRHSPHGKFVRHSPEAFAAYSTITGAIVHHPIERILIGDEERDLWQGRKEQLMEQNTVASLAPSRHAEIAPFITGEWEGYTILGGARVDTALVVQTFREQFTRDGVLIPVAVPPDELSFDGETWNWCGRRYRRVVWCEGYRAQVNPYWSWLPYLNAKGHVLRVRISGVPLGALTICGGKYLVRLGDSDEFLFGADYDWHWKDDAVDGGSVDTLLHTLRSMLRADIELHSARAGIRTVLMDFGAVLGAHPDHPALFICNGLGAKGALLAPAFATMLINHILDGAALPREHNVARYWQKTVPPRPVE
ncbi:MAG: FAD-binding oxidoreductase [Candidatus Kapabacteria bacterium]|nr:FAD-binding oxidoreductase [Candidatus Kapabacteria bacterium]